MSENESIRYRTAKKWRIRLFPLASAVNNAFYLLMMYISYLTAGGYGLLVAVSGAILTGTRIFDGITDPICAFITDRVNTKHGKVRILQWIGWGVMSLACFLMFFVGIGHGAVVFTVLYMLYILGYTIFGVATNTGYPIITTDPKQRPLLARWNTLYTMIIMMGGNMVIMSAVLPLFGNEYSIPMLQATCLGIIVISAILLVLSNLAIAPYDKPENFEVGAKREKPIGLKDCWALLKDNRALQMFIIAASSDKLALTTASNTAFTTLLFGVLIGNMSLSAIMSALTLPLSLVGAVLATRMASRKGNKYALTYWTWFAIAFAALGAVVYAVVPLNNVFKSIVPTVLFLAVTILRQLGQNGISACTQAMLADVADYEASRSGNFLPGTVAACYSFVDKLVSSLATTVAGLALSAVGYVSVMPQPTDAATSATIPFVIIMTLGLPILGWLCTILAMKWYPLTKEKMVEVQQKNNELREAARTAE
ncbi:MAG: MFS transporter [Elusimicrobiales bacterium]|nr:MFS transporter [Elusimicrobiales bacterium]